LSTVSKNHKKTLNLTKYLPQSSLLPAIIPEIENRTLKIENEEKAHICEGLKKEVRCMAAFTASRCNPAIREFTQRRRQEGKTYKVVMTVCMRKLLIILNVMVRN